MVVDTSSQGVYRRFLAPELQDGGIAVDKLIGDVALARFETPDEVRTFEKGRFELVRIGAMTLGRASYEPGWKWSEHVGKALGKKSCEVEHVGLVLSGRAAVAMDDGRVLEMRAGDLFYISPGH